MVNKVNLQPGMDGLETFFLVASVMAILILMGSFMVCFAFIPDASDRVNSNDRLLGWHRLVLWRKVRQGNGRAGWGQAQFDIGIRGTRRAVMTLEKRTRTERTRRKNNNNDNNT